MEKLLIKLKAFKHAIKECVSWSHLLLLVKSKDISKLYDAYHCLYGTYIDYLYWKHKEILHPMDVLQLEFRHKVMNASCYLNGSCIKCGCTTTALQGAKKSCDGNCYPYWINRKEFESNYTKAIYIQIGVDSYKQEIILKEEVIELFFNKNNI